jgi:hypothetical protein
MVFKLGLEAQKHWRRLLLNGKLNGSGTLLMQV